MTTETLRQVDIDPQQARNAVGGLSVALGGLAVLAPATTASLLGVKSAGGGAGPLLVRMVGVRNVVMGLHTLQATGGDQRAAVQAGFAVGAVDVAAVLLAARKGAITKKAAFGIVLLLGVIAAAGVAATVER